MSHQHEVYARPTFAFLKHSPQPSLAPTGQDQPSAARRQCIGQLLSYPAGGTCDPYNFTYENFGWLLPIFFVEGQREIAVGPQKRKHQQYRD